MRYYYVPSTYRGRKFGFGIRGGAVRGFGCLVKGPLKGGYLKVYAEPSTLTEPAMNPISNPFDDFPDAPRAEENIVEKREKRDVKEHIFTENEKARNLEEKVTEAETTGQPVSIGKKLYEFGKKVVTHPITKTVASVALTEVLRNYLRSSNNAQPAPQITKPNVTASAPETAGIGERLWGKIKDYINSQYDIPNDTAPTPKTTKFDKSYMGQLKDYFYPAKVNADKEMNSFYPDSDSVYTPIKRSIWGTIKNYFTRKKSGSGWRFRKGSPEAKAYMARLRSMKRTKRRINYY